MGLFSKGAELASVSQPCKDVVGTERHNPVAAGSFDVSQCAFFDEMALLWTFLGTSIRAFSRLDIFKGWALLSHDVVLLV